MKKTKLILVILIIIILLIKCEFNIIKLNKKVERLERKNNGEIILFLGDSITQRYKTDIYLSNYYIINSGIGGNTTVDILNDMENRVYKHKASRIFILIGINDILFTKEKENEIIDNTQKIINNIKEDNNCKIYLQSVYPINTKIKTEIPVDSNKKIKKYNKKLRNVCNNDVCEYINMYDLLIDGNGNLKRIYTNDGIHINKLGYVIISKELAKYLNK